MSYAYVIHCTCTLYEMYSRVVLALFSMVGQEVRGGAGRGSNNEGVSEAVIEQKKC